MEKTKKKGVEQMKEVCWSYGGTGAAISGAAAAIGTWITARLGGWDEALMLLVGCMALDFAIGFLAAGKNGELNSKAAFWGGVNKIVVLCLVAVGVGLDNFLPLEQPFVRTAVVCFYIGREGLSLLENYGKLGGHLPQFLKNLLAQLKDYGDQGGNTSKEENENE